MHKPDVDVLDFFSGEDSERIVQLINHMLTIRHKNKVDAALMPTHEELAKVAGEEDELKLAINPTLEYFRLFQILSKAGYDGAEHPIFEVPTQY